MSVEAIDDVYVTIIPATEENFDTVHLIVEAEGLPVDVQTQFVGKATLETAVVFSRDAIAKLSGIIRKLLDADRIAEIIIEHGERRVTLRGIPADRAQTVAELTDHLMKRLAK